MSTKQAALFNRIPGKGIWGLVLLLCLVFVAGRIAGWASQRNASLAIRREILAELERLGAHYYYDYQLLDAQTMILADDNHPSARKHWLAERWGKDFFHDVFYVTFAKINAQPQAGVNSPAAKHVAEVDDRMLQALGDLSELRWLALTGSAITDNGLKALSRLPRIERLWVGQTNITDVGLQRLASIPTLTHLWIEATPTSDRGLAALVKLPNLKSLSLGSPLFTATGLRQLREAKSLEQLFLDQLPVDDQVLEALGNLNQLRLLSIRQSRITDLGLKSLSKLQNLQELHLDGCRLSDAGLAVASSWPNLEKLSITNTPLGDGGLQHLAGCKKLKSLLVGSTTCSLSGVLDLTVNRLGRSLPEGLKTAFDTKLSPSGDVVSLNLSSVPVSDNELEHLRGLPKLQWLDIRHSRLTDAGAQQLVDLGFRDLQLLKLDDCEVTDVGVRALASLAGLRDLHVRQTRVTQAMVDELRKSKPSLRIYREPLPDAK